MFCVKCGGPGNLMCGRCFDVYCHEVCQINDWHSHKKVCKEMPSLISIPNILKEYLEQENQQQINKKPLVKQSNGVKEKRKDIDPPNAVNSYKNPSAKLLEALQCVGKEDRKLNINEFPLNKLKYQLKPVLKLNAADADTDEEGINEAKVYYFANLKVNPLVIGNNMPLVVTDKSLIDESIVAVIPYDVGQRKIMAHNMSKVAKFCKKNVPQTKRGYSPKINEMCLAIYDEDNKWYRAYCINDQDAKNCIYTLQFVDYGNITDVSRNHILPIAKSLMFPSYNNLCRILNDAYEIPKLKAAINKRPIIDCDIRGIDKYNMYEIFVTNLDELE